MYFIMVSDVDVGHVAERIVNEMREKIHKKTQLTASAGKYSTGFCIYLTVSRNH